MTATLDFVKTLRMLGERGMRRERYKNTRFIITTN